MSFDLIRLIAFLVLACASGLSYANDPAVPITVEPMEWNPPQQQQKARKIESLLSDPSRALGSKLIDLGKPPLQPKAQNPSSIGPRQIGFGRDVPELKTNSDTSSQLEWKPVNGGLVGSIAIQSTGAEALRVGLRVDAIPDSAEVRFFSKDAAEVELVSGKQIAETVKRNLDAGDPEETAKVFWSPVMKGTIAGVEIFLPSGVQASEVQISVPQVSHFYQSLQNGVLSPRTGIGSSAACEQDAVCSSAWTTTSNAVAQMVYIENANPYICTGTLLNDTAGDGIPYFLTANHCISTQSVASSLQTYWFWYASYCNSGVLNPGNQTIPAGATLLYNSPVTDTSFLRLNSSPPLGVSFAGWSATTPIIGTSVTGLHNPQGDLRKISIGSLASFFTCIDAGSNSFSCSSTDSISGNYLQALYTLGITEGGSSGSAVFDASSKHVIGQLRGGTLTCSNPTGYTAYGRFDKAYTNGNLGQWLSAVTPITYSLTVSNSGNGTITSSPSGINCGSNCSASFNSGASVTLTATPNTGYIFSGWTGACSGTGACIVTMNSNQTVGTSFSQAAPNNYLVTVNNMNSLGGTVTSNSGKVNCGSSCSNTYTAGYPEVLYAVPNSGYTFTGWTGDCFNYGTSPCNLSIDANKIVGANFMQVAPTNLTVTVTNMNPSGGSIRSSSGKINCGSLCFGTYTNGSIETLTAVPNQGFIFTGWSEGCSGTGACVLTISANQNVTANFSQNASDTITLNASVVPPGSSNGRLAPVVGSGTLISTPSGIFCTVSGEPSCSAKFPKDSTVIIRAVPELGSHPEFWQSLPGPSSPTPNGAREISITLNNIVNSVRIAFLTHYSLTIPSQISGGNYSLSSTSAVDISPAYFLPGTVVTVTPNPNPGYGFSGWSGDCSGSGSCQLTMNADHSVGLSFTKLPDAFAKLIVTKPSLGLITGSTANINCGIGAAQCTSFVQQGSVLTLTSYPKPGYFTRSWSGCSSSDGDTCNVVVGSAPIKVSANYSKLPTYNLIVKKTKGGIVTSDPRGISCSASKTSCSSKFASGTTVTLFAVASAGRSFAGWSGECSGTGACTVMMDRVKAVSAAFQ